MSDWNVPETEEGLQSVLNRIADLRKEQESAELGYGLLRLAYLVKWVRSDINQSPFERSGTLSEEALGVFQRVGDRAGQVRAMLSLAPFVARDRADNFFIEAESIAQELGEEHLGARVLNRKGVHIALVDPKAAKAIQLEALTMFRRLGDLEKVSEVLFALAILPGEDVEKRDYALEAVELYRKVGDLKHSIMSLQLAFMNIEEEEYAAHEELLQRALDDAQEIQHRYGEAWVYGRLAIIAAQKNEHESADTFLRWQKDIDESDGLSPLEKWEGEVAMTKMMIGQSKKSGSKEAVQMFQANLKELKKNRPSK